MLNLFRSTRLMYLLGLIGYAIIAILAIDGNWVKFLFIMLGTIIWTYCLAFVTNFIAGKKMKKIYALRDEIEFKKYQEAIQELLEKNAKNIMIRNNKFVRSFLLNNLAGGYFDEGDDEKAFKALNDMDYFPKSRYGAAYKFVYNNNMLVYYFRKEDIDKAEECLKNMEIILKETKFKKTRREQYQDCYLGNQLSLKAAKGDFEGFVEYFEARIPKDDTLIKRVVDSGALGEVYLRTAQNEKAKELFKYVVDNGKDSCYAKKARELLSEMATEE